jgi:ankyrin repeat protein
LGIFPLNFAVAKHGTAVTKLLISKGALPDEPNLENGITPLGSCCILGCKEFETLSILLQHGANVNREVQFNGIFETYLHMCIKIGNSEIVRTLLNAKANVNRMNSQGMAPIHMLTLCKHLVEVKKMLKDLLNAGADINLITSKTNQTARALALEQNNEETAQILLDNGANP